MQYAIQTEHLSRSFGSIRAVQDISLQVPEASVFGFLGPNGAGKTTTIRMLLGLIRPTEGEVSLHGLSLRQNHREALKKVGAIVETPALYPNLTARENLQLSIRTHGGHHSEIMPLISMVRLDNALDRRVSNYSLGMRQRLALARAMLNRPKILILDEPTNGLDPAGIAEFRELIISLPKEFGTTVFLSSHLLAEVEQTVTYCALLHQGRLLFQGSLEQMEQQFSARIEIESSRPRSVVQALQTKAFPASLEYDKICIDQSMNIQQREHLLKELVAADLPVSGFQVQRPSLEQIFFKLTGQI